MPLKPLNLDGLHLGEIEVGKVIAMMKTIPADVEVLSLCKNNLRKFSDDDLCSVLSALPEGIKKLDLSKNGLVSKSDANYKGIVSATPASVQTIALVGHVFMEKSKILDSPDGAWATFLPGMRAEIAAGRTTAAGAGELTDPDSEDESNAFKR